VKKSAFKRTKSDKKTAVKPSPKNHLQKSVTTNAKCCGVRGTAALVLEEVHHHGKSLTQVLPLYSQQLPANEQPFLQELCYGSCRWYFRLQALLNVLLEKPLRSKERMVSYLLIIGLYQLIYLNKPEYAVVQETVDELHHLKKSWAKGLVNAVLRRFLRESEQLLEGLDRQPADQYAHPQWLLDFLFRDWREYLNDKNYRVHDILEANNQYPPFWIRVNRQQANLADYQARLERANISSEFLASDYDALLLPQAQNVENLPDFKLGTVSVQDVSAQFAAHLLAVPENAKVLDVCAAPGGKTAHILEHQKRLKYLLAVDISKKRLEQVEENLKRIGLTADIRQGDAVKVDDWWDGESFDRILIDAPCSATGVIRRHPDIKILRRKDDIHSLVELQQQILNKIWPLLKPGGVLLYATCSILRDENDRQIIQFLNSHEDAFEIKISLPVGREMAAGWQIFPGQGQGDGFYYAKITKKA